MKKIVFWIFFFVISTDYLFAQVSLKFTVKEAPEWTTLFKRGSGWFGADGIFTVALNGRENCRAAKKTKTLFWFSDTMIGELLNNSPVKSKMVHNSTAILSGYKPDTAAIRFYWKGDDFENAESLFSPPKSSYPKTDFYYWLGDGFRSAKDNLVYIFAYRMYNKDKNDDWSFTQNSIDILSIPIKNKSPRYDEVRTLEMPAQFHRSETTGEISWGAGVLNNTRRAGAKKADGFIYIYGVRGKEKQLLVARVRETASENFDQWKFWNGKTWVENADDVQPVTNGVSNELSVSRLSNGKYALVFQQNGMSPHVAMRVGESPAGPFGELIKVYETKDQAANKNYFTYNAKAHPGLSKPGELLISYNMNSFDFFKEIKKNGTLYRPRFIKIIFEK